jgi:hypothetical protein
VAPSNRQCGRDGNRRRFTQLAEGLNPFALDSPKVRWQLPQRPSKLWHEDSPILLGHLRFGAVDYCDKFATTWKIQAQYTAATASGALLAIRAMVTFVRIRRLALQRVELEAPRALRDLGRVESQGDQDV